MPRATRYPCSGCGNSFVPELFLQQNTQLCCLFCDTRFAALAEVKELKEEVTHLKEELRQVRSLVQDGKAVEDLGSSQSKDKDNTEVNSDDGFTFVRNGRKANARSVESAAVPLQNRFAALQSETKLEPDVVLVGDSLVRGQDNEFCREKPRRKHRCYPGRKIEDITERVDYLVEHSTKDSLFVTVVGTNNLRCDTATDIVAKYRAMIREFASRRRKAAVCSIIPRYDVDPATFRKMSVVNRQVEALCRQEGMYFFDLWHHFCSDKTLYARDGIHLNCVGKARLGRVIGECLADIPRPPDEGNGSTAEEDTASVASEVTVVSEADDSHTAPDTEDVERQEEEGTGAAVPLPPAGSSREEDFH